MPRARRLRGGRSGARRESGGEAGRRRRSRLVTSPAVVPSSTGLQGDTVRASSNRSVSPLACFAVTGVERETRSTSKTDVKPLPGEVGTPYEFEFVCGGGLRAVPVLVSERHGPAGAPDHGGRQVDGYARQRPGRSASGSRSTTIRAPEPVLPVPLDAVAGRVHDGRHAGPRGDDGDAPGRRRPGGRTRCSSSSRTPRSAGPSPGTSRRARCRRASRSPRAA